MDSNINHRSSLDFEKTLDEFWHSTCPTNKAEKAKKKHNSEEQTWRYSTKQNTDKQKEKAVLIQRFAINILKETDLTETVDKELKKLFESLKSAAEKVEKITVQIEKRIDQIRSENKQSVQLLKKEEEEEKKHGEDELNLLRCESERKKSWT